jgi:hypothetical protein
MPFALPVQDMLNHLSDDYYEFKASEAYGDPVTAEEARKKDEFLRDMKSRGVPQAHAYLRDLTGQDFGTDYLRWKEYLDSVGYREEAIRAARASE